MAGVVFYGAPGTFSFNPAEYGLIANDVLYIVAVGSGGKGGDGGNTTQNSSGGQGGAPGRAGTGYGQYVQSYGAPGGGGAGYGAGGGGGSSVAQYDYRAPGGGGGGGRGTLVQKKITLSSASPVIVTVGGLNGSPGASSFGSYVTAAPGGNGGNGGAGSDSKNSGGAGGAGGIPGGGAGGVGAGNSGSANDTNGCGGGGAGGYVISGGMLYGGGNGSNGLSGDDMDNEKAMNPAENGGGLGGAYYDYVLVGDQKVPVNAGSAGIPGVRGGYGGCCESWDPSRTSPSIAQDGTKGSGPVPNSTPTTPGSGFVHISW